MKDPARPRAPRGPHWKRGPSHPGGAHGRRRPCIPSPSPVPPPGKLAHYAVSGVVGALIVQKLPAAKPPRARHWWAGWQEASWRAGGCRRPPRKRALKAEGTCSREARTSLRRGGPAALGRQGRPRRPRPPALIMSAVLVRSVATGRARLTSCRGCATVPAAPGLVDERLTGLSGFRALRVFPRTGSVVIWMAPTDLDVDALVSALEEAPGALGAREAHPVRTGLLHRRSRPARGRRGPSSPSWRCAGCSPGPGSASAAPASSARSPSSPVCRSSGAPCAPCVAGAVPGRTPLVTAATVISLVLRENVVALTVLWLLNIGEFLQTLTLRRTRRAIEDLLTIGEERVWLVREEGVEVEVPSNSWSPGDTVAVYEHSPHSRRRPCDRRRGPGRPGPPSPARRCPCTTREGAHVYAGTIVTSGSLTVRADSVGRDTTVGRIITRVEEAQTDRAPHPDRRHPLHPALRPPSPSPWPPSRTRSPATRAGR